jgi:hypothetical protein
VAPSTFAERFGFARWLRFLATGEASSFAEIGRAVDRTGQAVSAWSSAGDAPTDWRVHEPLAAFLSVEDAWLVKNAGEPPRADLWAVWIAARRPKVAKRLGPSVIKEPPEDTYDQPVAPAKRASKKRA